MAAESVGLTAEPEAQRLRFFGHSLGAAACLIAAEEFDIRQGVLVAPFTSTMEMSRRVTGLPLGFLVTHRYDNEARLDDLLAHGPTKILILHGTDDEVIPVDMGRKLAQGRGNAVRLIEIDGARHNDIARTHPDELARTLVVIGG
jgi:pimeloyl-ACP methyl ester carboxylesterase